MNYYKLLLLSVAALPLIVLIVWITDQAPSTSLRRSRHRRQSRDGRNAALIVAAIGVLLITGAFLAIRFFVAPS